MSNTHRSCLRFTLIDQHRNMRQKKIGQKKTVNPKPDKHFCVSYSRTLYVGHMFFSNQQRLILYRHSSCSSSRYCNDLFKKAQCSVVSNRIGVKFGRIVLQVNTHLLTDRRSRIFDMTSSHFQDGGNDVISHRKVMPSGECIRSLYTLGVRCCMQQRTAICAR